LAIALPFPAAAVARRRARPSALILREPSAGRAPQFGACAGGGTRGKSAAPTMFGHSWQWHRVFSPPWWLADEARANRVRS